MSARLFNKSVKDSGSYGASSVVVVRDSTLLWLICAGLAWFSTDFFTLPHQAENTLEDLTVSYFSRVEQVRDDIVILTITEESLALLPYRSPISRRYLAEILGSLITKGPAVIGLDIIFDQATELDADIELQQVIEQSDVPIIVATGRGDTGLTEKQFEFQNRYLSGLTTGDSALLTSDGVVRDAYLGTPENPSFAYALYNAITPIPDIEPKQQSSVKLDYPGLTDSFELPFSTYPIHLGNLLPGAWIKDRAILVGGELPHQDRHATPYSMRIDDVSGVTIHALALSQLIDKRRANRLGTLASIGVILALTALGLVTGSTTFGIWTRMLGLAGLVTGYWTLVVWVHLENRMLLAPLSPVVGLILCTVVSSLYYGRHERRTRRFMENAFGHYVSPQIITALTKAEKPLALGGEAREMSFVFTDLEAFTTMSERLEPSHLVELLQQYLGGLVDIAFKYDATIDRFVGDAIHVFFGAPVDQIDHAQRAVRCAMAMDTFSESFRTSKESSCVKWGITRIGVHSGTAVVGNVGGMKLFSYTAHGDVVNTTARLESANKELGTRICMSDAVVEANPDLLVRPIGDLLLRGKEQPQPAYSPTKGIDESLVQGYTTAFDLLEQSKNRTDRSSERIKSAQAAFAELAERFPEDPLVIFHHRRLQRGKTGTTIRLEGS